MGFQNPIVGGTALRAPAIQSPGYTPGSSGWIVKIDGSAEFNDVVIRGGTVISGTALYYDGTPALGNLILSIAAAAGTDSYGNAYVKGLGVYGAPGTVTAKDSAGDTAELTGNVGGGGQLSTLPGLAMQLVHNTGDPATLGALDDGTHTNLSLLLTSPSNAVGGIPGTNFSQIKMVGADSAPCEIDLTAQVTAIGGTSFDANGLITSYDNDTFSTYTPTVSFGGGTVTFSRQFGIYQRVGKMVYFTAYMIVNNAGSGASNVQITTPTAIDRNERQIVGAHLDGLTAALNGHGFGLSLTTGTGAAFDRLRSYNNANVTGADLLAGATITIQGWYREA